MHLICDECHCESGAAQVISVTWVLDEPDTGSRAEASEQETWLMSIATDK